MSPHDKDEKTLNLCNKDMMDHLPPSATEDRGGLIPAKRVDNLHDRPPVLVLLLQVDAVALLHQEPEHVRVAVLHRLQHRVPAPVHEVDVGAPLQQQLQDLRVAPAHAPDGLDDGQVLPGRVDVGAGLADEVAHDVLVALADGGGQGREDAAVLVLDREAGAQEEPDALELVRAHGHLHHALEHLRVGHGGEQPLEDGRTLHRHAERPVLAPHRRVGPAREEEVDHIGAVLADGRRQRRMALGRLGVDVGAAVQQVHERLHVVVLHGPLDDAPRLVEVPAGAHDLREEVRPLVRHALEARVLRRGQVRVRAVGQEEGDDLGAVVADGGAQRRVHAVLLGVGVDARVEEDPHRLGVVDAGRELHDARRQGRVRAARQEELEEVRVVAARPEGVLGAGEVWVRAPVQEYLREVEPLHADGLGHGACALAVLAVGVTAVVEHELDDRLRCLVVDGPDQDRVTIGHDPIRVAAIRQEQLHELELALHHGQRERRVALRARAQVRVCTVFDEHLGALEEAPLGGLVKRRKAARVEGIWVGAEEEQEPDRLSIAVYCSLPEEVDLLDRVGRDSPVEQLFDDAMVLLLYRLRQRDLELRVVKPRVMPWCPPGDRGRVGPEAGDWLWRLVTDFHSGHQILEKHLGICRRGRQPSVPDADGRIHLVATDRPPKDQRRHPQGLAGLLQARPHLVHVRVGKDHLEALGDPGEAVTPVVVEEPRHQLVEHDEVVVGLAEAPLQLQGHVGGDPRMLPVDGLAQARLDGPQEPAHLQEVGSEVPEPLDLVLHGADVLEHADGDGVAQHGGPLAELQRGLLLPGGHGRWLVYYFVRCRRALFTSDYRLGVGPFGVLRRM
ncbi:hypothetical protein VPNG_07070 [Cytospora leucostoma]|uniref:Uncharacterized protein n=1 Tax=Cytospora leucostoma TaxID=1230097 RepID=A0A423WVD5_9PEZI|nr:hypothetical protein VPNG_07070 [Cytospora leucostoma]